MRCSRVRAAVWCAVLGAARALTPHQTRELHVVSLELPRGYDRTAAATNRAWRWKSAVLGDDQGLPRPKAARALAEELLHEGVIAECAVLATCARLDVIVAADAVDAGGADAVRAAVGRQLAAQVEAWRGADHGLWARSARWLDGAAEEIRAAPKIVDDFEVSFLCEALTLHAGTFNATRHLALVAAGAMADDDFDPFCSRRAHIQKQLRACLETATATPAPPAGPTIKACIESALRAGARARDVSGVEVAALRRDRDNKSLKKAALEAGRGAALAAADAAVRDLSAVDAAPRIVALRKAATLAAEAVARSGARAGDVDAALAAARGAANEALHLPTLALRSGASVDEATVVRDVDAAARRAVALLPQSAESHARA
ncbi:hypothetical protein M885DRAFT_621299 [Pelagophyceae sp. CCMP2097]|nr:hypothetical protein M885DRAFT_621299 [Pelagophyceae sp. CCMP2097]